MSNITNDHRIVNTNPRDKALSQSEFLLSLLREAGASGVNKLHFLNGDGPCSGRRITQVSARVFELERAGYVIEHRKIPDSEFVTFVLLSEPTGKHPIQPELRLEVKQINEFLEHEMGAR